MGLLPTMNQILPNTPQSATPINSNFANLWSVINGNITNENIAINSVYGNRLVGASIPQGKLGAASVETANIIDLNVTGAKLANDTIPLGKLQQNSVETSNIVNGTIKAEDLNITDIQNAGLCTTKYTEISIPTSATWTYNGSSTTYLDLDDVKTIDSVAYNRVFVVTGFLTIQPATGTEIFAGVRLATATSPTVASLAVDSSAGLVGPLSTASDIVSGDKYSLPISYTFTLPAGQNAKYAVSAGTNGGTGNILVATFSRVTVLEMRV